MRRRCDRLGHALSVRAVAAGVRASALNLYLATAFGAKFDGVTDDTAAIQAAIGFVAGLPHGGTLLLPAGTAKISSTLTLTASNVRLEGCGQGRVVLGAIAYGTRLLWAGGSSTMLAVGAASSLISNVRVMGILLDCNAGAAATALSIKSVKYSYFDVGYFEPSGTGVLLDTVTTGADCSTQFNHLWIHGSSTLYPAKGIVLDGTADPANGNSSFNVFEHVDLSILNGDGFTFNVADNNIVQVARCFGRPGGTANAVVFNGNNVNANYTANANVLRHLTSNRAIIGRGTGSFTFASTNNTVFADASNSTPKPTIETGASVWYADTSGNVIGKTGKVTPVAVANLPPASNVGAGTRAFVTDATTSTFGSIVAGGGSVSVPVYSDDTNWKIG